MQQPLQTVNQVPVEPDQIIPIAFSYPAKASASKAIIRDYWIEYPPTRDGEYTYEFRDMIQIDFGDNISCINFPECYFRMEITITGVDQATFAFIGTELGAESLFRNVYLTTGQGDIRFIDGQDYHRNSYLWSCYSGTKGALKSLCASSGDSCQSYKFGAPASDPTQLVQTLRQPNGNEAGVTYNLDIGPSPSTTFTGVLNGYGPINTGDIIMSNIEAGDPPVVQEIYTVVVTSVSPVSSSTTNFTCQQLAGPVIVGEVATVNARVLRMNGQSPFEIFSRRSYSRTAANNAAPLTITQEVCFKIRDEIMDILWPLFLMNGGMRWRMQLEHPKRAFRNLAPNRADIAEFSYNVKNIRFVARMVQLHPNIRSAIRQQFNDNTGIQMATTAIRTIVDTTPGTASTDTISVNIGLRNVEMIVVMLQDDRLSNGTDANTFAAPSLTHALRDGYTELYAMVGAMKYPERELRLDMEGRELYLHYLHAYERINDGYDPARLSLDDFRECYRYYPNSATDTYAADARTSLMTFTFTRYKRPLSFLTGLDLHQTPFVLYAKRDGVVTSHRARNSYQNGTDDFTGNLQHRFKIFYTRVHTLSGPRGVSVSE